MRPLSLALFTLLALGACDSVDSRDAGGGARDAANSDRDAGADRADAAVDAGRLQDGGPDAGPEADAGAGSDAGATADAGADGGGMDAGSVDAGRADAGRPDAGRPDAGRPDAGRPDAGPPSGGCLSGAVGTHVARIRWRGTTSGSTAYVSYEANTLPDTSRWRVTANSRSIGYRPVFRDPFLGEGGLDMSGTVFIDVEISTALLSTMRNATLAIYGRSFNTTASGSFSWMSFSGSGATPSGYVSNVAPYRWYPANATSALPAGDGTTLLRIQAGPPSNSIIVSRLEICFDAS